MAYQDVYKLVDTSELQGQVCENVYFFQNQNLGEGGASAQDVAEQYISDLLPSVTRIQTGDLLHTGVTCVNLFDGSDNFETVISQAGQNTTGFQTMPDFNAYGFKLVQNNGLVKNGAKRYAGVAEAAQVNGVITDTTFIGYLEALGTALATPLTMGLVNTFVPVIVKRLLVSGDYVLPGTLAEAVIGAVIDALYSEFVTSQVSRKHGVGI